MNYSKWVISSWESKSRESGSVSDEKITKPSKGRGNSGLNRTRHPGNPMCASTLEIRCARLSLSEGSRAAWDRGDGARKGTAILPRGQI